MNRFLISAKRRFFLNVRVICISVIIWFLTLSIAYYHRSLEISLERINEKSGQEVARTFRNLKSEQVYPIRSFVKNQSFCEKPPDESEADFNTFEMYKSVVGWKRNIDFLPKNQFLKKKKEKLKVFVLPFSHVDPGWLQTFEKYTESTNKILTNMHQFMTMNQNMTFMWAETIFFERWWSQQDEKVKSDVRRLVQDGRFELASGSWVMTDEASSYFPVSVDNIVEGFQFVHQNFGIKPSVIWSNDPFGYSNTVPYLFSKTGIKRNVINRIHHELKKTLQANKAIPFKWRQYFDTSGKSDILTQVLPYTHYDILNSCGPNQAICCEFDFKRITHWQCPGPKPVAITKENVAMKADRLLSQLETMAEMYKAPVILMMHGDDFRYDMIEEWHQHYDNFMPLFEHINKGDRAEIRFGTFDDYFTELEKYYRENPENQPPVLSGDFFPYQCALGDYWTGYFTTRPFFKKQGRQLHNLIRSADILLARTRNILEENEIKNSVQKLQESRRVLSLFQHHDAITGTSKISVMENYSNLLYNSMLEMRKLLESFTKKAIGTTPEMIEFPMGQKETESLKIIEIGEGKERELQIFNSLPYEIEDLITIRVSSSRVFVNAEDGTNLEAQIDPFFEKGSFDSKSFLLIFRANLQPLSYSKFSLKHGSSDFVTTSKFYSKNSSWSSIFEGQWEFEKRKLQLKNQRIKTEHDEQNGNLKGFTNEVGTFDMAQRWAVYKQARGGAYLMKLHPNYHELDTDINFLLIFGKLRSSIHQFHRNFYQRTSLKNVEGANGNEIEIQIRVDIRNEKNTELMIQFQTNFEEEPETFTDSVGLQLLRRESYKLPVEANYYPMPTSAVIQKDSSRLTIVSNLEHGARFMEHGTIEINIDRILNQDDGKGLGQDSDSIPIDMQPVEMNFKIIAEKIDEISLNKKSHYTVHTSQAQQALQSILYPPSLFSSEKSNEKRIEDIAARFPPDIQLLTIRPISQNQSLLILFRHSMYSCEKGNENLKDSLETILGSIGVKLIQKTDLSGVPMDEKPESLEKFNGFDVKVFDFLNLVVSF